jgi:hypothetical protein
VESWYEPRAFDTKNSLAPTVGCFADCNPQLGTFTETVTSIVVQGTLATLYRQRGDLHDCEAVLDMELEVLVRYTRSSEGACAQQVCFGSIISFHRRADQLHQLQRLAHTSSPNDSLCMCGAATVCSTSIAIFATTCAFKYRMLLLLSLLSASHSFVFRPSATTCAARCSRS